MAAKVTTAWGKADVLEEVRLSQATQGDPDLGAIVQLLGGPEGERWIRFAYTRDGIARRGPVTLRETDVARLHAELVDRPELAAALGLPAAASRRGGGRLRGRR
jgi:hypothetical protein